MAESEIFIETKAFLLTGSTGQNKIHYDQIFP
jgi:hypothetical protein